MNDPIVIGDPNPSGAGGAGATLLTGDVREVLRGLPAKSVQCCITSPPYWGLRAYGTPPQVWLNPNAPEGGWKAMGRCEHEWGDGGSGRSRDRQHVSDAPGARGGGLKASAKNHSTPSGDVFCQRCGAWRGELGQEPTPALFVEHLVEVFREVRRVLRPDGTLWLNLGDSYTSTGRSDRKESPGVGATQAMKAPGREVIWKSGGGSNFSWQLPGGLKPKDLCEIPSDVVRALRADGWWLRSRIPWLKRNAMPESASDRPTQAVEYVFLLTKAARYFYDYEAAKMAPSGKSGGACFGKVELDGPGARRHGKAERAKYDASRARRNSDWFFESWQGLYADDDAPLAFIVNPAAWKEAHFATFPPKLVEPMVKAGTSEKGCCPKCGTPWERVVEKKASTMNIRVRDAKKGILEDKSGFDRQESKMVHEIKAYGPERDGQSRTLGWRPGCECPEASSLEPQACVVLDPFSGAGTTAMVAAQLGRRAIGIDLSEKYNRMAATRIGKALNPLTFVDEDAEADLPLLTEKSP